MNNKEIQMGLALAAAMGAVLKVVEGGEGTKFIKAIEANTKAMGQKKDLDEAAKTLAEADVIALRAIEAGKKAAVKLVDDARAQLTAASAEIEAQLQEAGAAQERATATLKDLDARGIELNSREQAHKNNVADLEKRALGVGSFQAQLDRRQTLLDKNIADFEAKRQRLAAAVA